MSKKQINNRLDKLFDVIKEEEAATQKANKWEVQRTSHPVVEEVREATLPVQVSAQAEAKVTGNQSILSVPIKVDKESWMALSVFDDDTNREWHDEEKLLAEQVVDQLTLALENAHLFQESQQRTEELALVNKIVTEISSNLDLKANLSIIAREIAKIASALHVGITLLNEEKTHLILTADYPRQDEDLGMRIPLENNPTSLEVIENHQPISTQDIQNNPRMAAIKDVMKQRGTESLAIFPLLAGKEAIGTVGVDFSEPFTSLSEDQVNLIQTILLQAGTAIETARLFEKTESSASELRALFAAMDDVIFVVDRDTRYLRVAPTNPAGLFLAPEELLGKRMDEILPEETHDLFHQAIEKALQTGETINIEYPLKIDETETWFYASLSKLDEDQVYWVARDITERKESEKTLQRQNDYMTAAAEVGRLVTSTLDMDILFRRAVNLLREHFGYYHASIFTIEEAGFDAVVREATGEAGKEMKERQHSLTVGSKSVVGTATSTGEPFVVNDVSKSPNHHHNPLLPETKAEAAIPLRIGRRIIGALDLQATEINAFTPEDLIVLQILADQFATAIDNARSYKIAQDAFAEMREIDKLKSQFLANMSHELRTPLNSIIGFSRVILKGIDGPVTDLQQQDLSAIYNSGQHLLGLINDILDLSKIEAGKMELTFDEVDIEKLIKSVMSSVVGLIKDKPVRLEEEIEPDLPIVKADSMRLRQILLNLFSNASKFTDEGTIKVVARQEKNFVHVSVIDSGPGISEEDQKKLFQAFSQVDASATRATGGTGLGLSICQELVTMHGGEIGVDSVVGEGSTFHFTLPLFYPDVQLESKAQTTEKEILNDDNLPIILSIDDDEQVISLYERYLNAQGYHVVALTEPKKALARVKAIQPHAITLDIMMPGYNGWQVLEDLKSDPETQHIPIIVCSIVEDTQKGYALGATDYLLKPIIEDDLMNALSRINDSGAIREVLIIDDDPDDLRLMEKFLVETKKYEPVLAVGGLAGWDRIITHPPQAVILDLFMPEMDGFEIINAMQATKTLKDIPVIVISGGDISATQQEKLTKLNHDLLQKGSLDSQELLSLLEKNLNQIKKSGGKGRK
ncbi:MAG: response regulator [Anaerolineae bacterium]|jgi:PAS domain S-box-containing protein|nr:response regulator [Anaerolineae bacterium]MBT7192256.1 response regulator [Anaerolineae bacterium]MBT7990913.1 response regulator [Anaerolineae bacterium]